LEVIYKYTISRVAASGEMISKVHYETTIFPYLIDVISLKELMNPQPYKLNRTLLTALNPDPASVDKGPLDCVAVYAFLPQLLERLIQVQAQHGESDF
jgi:hypothetical protein